MRRDLNTLGAPEEVSTERDAAAKTAQIADVGLLLTLFALRGGRATAATSATVSAAAGIPAEYGRSGTRSARTTAWDLGRVLGRG